jgi:hypothetical protein
MQISTFPVCHVYFFHFNNFVQCLASFFSIYQFWYFYSLFCAFSPHYIIFYISFVFCQSVGRRLPCPRRPTGPRPLHWSPPPLPPPAAAPSALVSHARCMSRPPPSIGLTSPLLFPSSPHATWALPTRRCPRLPRRRLGDTVSLPAR